MPELPEVETVARGLRRTILGKTIARIVIRPKARIHPRARRFRALVAGATVVGIRRRGKNLLVDLSNEQTLWIHLKMTGRLNYQPAESPLDGHDHVIFHFKGSRYSLHFNDYRRFGRLQVHPRREVMACRGLAELGPEPTELTVDQFIALCRSRRRMIKAALLDQTLIAGLGNIYADESLYLSRIHPQRRTDTIAGKKLAELHGHIRNLFSRAIRLMGTSVDTFAGVNGRPGRFQNHLRVYGRQGQPCGRCGKKIRREKIGGRSAHYCPSCQRRK